VAREVAEVWDQVAIREHPEEDIAVVRHDRDVEAERVVDRHERPDVDELGAARVEGELRSGDVGRDDVHDRLWRPLHLRGHEPAG